MQTTFIVSKQNIFKVTIRVKNNKLTFLELTQLDELLLLKFKNNKSSFYYRFCSFQILNLNFYNSLKKKKIYNSLSTYIFKFLKNKVSRTFFKKIYLSKKQFFILNCNFKGGLNSNLCKVNTAVYSYDSNNTYGGLYSFPLPALYKFYNYDYLNSINLNKTYGFVWVFNLQFKTITLIFSEELKVLQSFTKNILILKIETYTRNFFLKKFFGLIFYKRKINFYTKSVFKLLINLTFGNFAANKLFSFINFYNLKTKLRPLQVSSSITSFARIYLSKFINNYYKNVLYFDTDSIYCKKPLSNKIQKKHIFFFKQLFKQNIIFIYLFVYFKKIYILKGYELVYLKDINIVKCKGRNARVLPCEIQFKTSSSLKKNKTVYKLLKNFINY